MPIIGNIGPLELLLVLALALLILGPGKLPEVGAALGRTIREFRRATTEIDAAVDPNVRPATPATAPTPAPPATPAIPPEPQHTPTEASDSPPAGA